MRVLLLNQTFHPDVAATAQHGWDLARHLVDEGHEVVAVTSRSIYGRTGSTLPARETIEGVEIRRVGRSLFGKSGTLGRLADFALWYLAAAVAVLRVPRCDVCVPFTTPPFIVLVGLLLRGLRGTRVVYWLMDLYPDVPVLHGMMKPRGLSTRLLERIHRAALRRADRVVVLGRCMAERVRAKGVSDERIDLVRVWADRDEVHADDPATIEARSAIRREWGIDPETFVVMYSGNFGMMHDAGTFLDAADRLRDRADIRFVFVGGGARTEAARARVERSGLGDRVRFEPYQPRERLGAVLTLADVHLVSMIEGSEGLVVPCKLFGILAAGRPVLFVGPASSEIGRVVNETGAGAVLRVGDADGLAETIAALADDRERAARMGDAGRAALESRYDRRLACRAFTEVLRDVVAREDRPPAEPGRATDADADTDPGAGAGERAESPTGSEGRAA